MDRMSTLPSSTLELTTLDLLVIGLSCGVGVQVPIARVSFTTRSLVQRSVHVVIAQIHTYHDKFIIPRFLFEVEF